MSVNVHNHGPSEGRGLDCGEPRLADGSPMSNNTPTIYTCQICGNEDEQLTSWRMLSIGNFHFLICPDHKDMSLAEIAENLDFSPRAEK